MKRIFFLILLALVSFEVCDAQSTTRAKRKRTKNGRIMWRMKLDFISKGAGIDNSTYDKVIAYAGNHEKKPAYNVIEKGKVGEKQVYFGLAEMTDDEQYAFVDEVGKMIPDRKRVRMETTLPKRKVAPVAEAGKDNIGIPVQVKYRVVLSFISKGAGVDQAAEEKIKDYITSHPKKPAYEVKMWGREGERDYVMHLAELSPVEQKNFVKEVNKLISSSDMVFLKENEVYVKKGR